MFHALVFNGEVLTPEQPDPVVPWWSFTKTVLSVTALSLVRDGLVGLDDHVLEAPFTLRQLLRHEAGLADYGELPEYHAAVASNQAPWPVDDMLQRLDASRLRYVPGTAWRYSNVGYTFVLRMIERVTGLGIEQAIVRQVLRPLGLSEVHLARTPADLQGSCLGVAPLYDPAWVYHGLLVGRLSDAAVLLNRVLAGDLLPHSLLQEMLTVRLLGGPIPGRPWTAPGYALGLMQGVAQGGLTLNGHTGAGPHSVVAFYHCADAGSTATCAVFREGANQGAAEMEAVRLLTAALSKGCR
jgi:CubicO group peptidase (beta-lactamase class C family)